MSKVVLGRGIEALIPVDSKQAREEGKYRLVPLDLIAPNPLQPRHDFDEDALQQLADSLKRNGMIQPLVVKQSDSGFTLIEIIVVLVLVSLVASMVGPQIVNRIEKIKVSAEKKKFESIFDTAKDTSFCRGSEIFIKLKMF